MRFRSLPRLGACAVAALVFGVLVAAPSAHDIPADTTVRMFIKPEGFVLHVLARVQMASINDIDWPMHRDTGYLDLAQIDPFLRDAATMWISDYMDVYEANRKLAAPDVASVRLAADGDQSFNDTYDVAFAHMRGEKIPPDTNLFPLQGNLDVMFDYKINSPLSSFSIDPRFDRLGLRVTTELQFIRSNGAVRSFEYVGLPGLVHLDPSTWEAAWRFVQTGFFHLLASAETLLFLICLALPFRRTNELVPAIVVFAIAYSLTFIASAAFHMAPDELWFQPFISTVLAVSIFYAAIENILGARLDRRWIVALVFGLAYGFSFAASLQTMLQFAGAHPGVSIVGFTAGIDAAIAAVMLLIVLGAALLFRFIAEERIGTIVVSAIIAHTAWHWMASRYVELRRYPLQWPALDLLLLAATLRWLMFGVVLAAIVWAMRGIGAYGASRATGEADKPGDLYQPTK